MIFTVSFCEKSTSQIGHLKSSIPLWIAVLCLLCVPFSEKQASQMLHLNGFSFMNCNTMSFQCSLQSKCHKCCIGKASFFHQNYIWCIWEAPFLYELLYYVFSVFLLVKNRHHTCCIWMASFLNELPLYVFSVFLAKQMSQMLHCKVFLLSWIA